MNLSRCLPSLTRYAIRRDHCNSSGFFRVNVPEAGHIGAGFQLRVGPMVYGVSLWWELKVSS